MSEATSRSDARDDGRPPARAPDEVSGFPRFSPVRNSIEMIQAHTLPLETIDMDQDSTVKRGTESNSLHGPPIQVDVRGLSKFYGKQVVAKDVSFTLRAGEIVGLLGPNGAGKSTVMMMMAGLLAPAGGEVLINFKTYNGQHLQQRRLFGLVPQEYAIYQELSALRNLMFFGRMYQLSGADLKDRCDEVLEEIGLKDHARQPVRTFSGGMKRRLNFGIGMVHRPSILILDEPTLGVDPHSRSRLIECIQRHVAKGGSVLYASHNLEEAQSICQRVVILDHGEVIANDSISNLLASLPLEVCLYVSSTSGLENALGEFARVTLAADQHPAVILTGPQRSVERPAETSPSSDRSNDADANGVDANDVPVTQDFMELLQMTLRKLSELGIRVLRMEAQKASLEKVFLNLTGKELKV